MDLDGNLNLVINAFLDCGINFMHPMEPAGGMDIVEIRKKYGSRFAMRGGIDKHVLRHSQVDIQAEQEYKTGNQSSGWYRFWLGSQNRKWNSDSKSSVLC